jgi:4-diphosphocytidyl-2-C-methyl-D-erythritol kinase
MPTTVRSHAKINLGLAIGAPRADGFHALATVYQTLELHDLVTVTARPAARTALRLTSNDSRVPTDERNTAWKMTALALEALGLTAEVEIHIEKHLPVQGGLGAGSANAVAALVGLEAELGIEMVDSHPSSKKRSKDGAPVVDAFHPGRKNQNVAGMGRPEVHGFPSFEQKTLEGWGTQGLVASHPSSKKRSKDEAPGEQGWAARRLEMAAKVGSDVPLFLIGGRGQEVYPLPDFEPVWCVVATPEVGVSTPQAFGDWDVLCLAEGLTAEASTDKLNKLSRAYVSAFAGAIPEGRQGVGSSGVPSNGGDLAGPQESALVRTGITSWIENDFERVVFPQHPSLAEIKRILWGSGTPEAALHASLSGSGSALYGLYKTRVDAEAAGRRLRMAGVRSQLTRTLPRASYWQEMLLPQAG